MKADQSWITSTGREWIPLNVSRLSLMLALLRDENTCTAIAGEGP